MCLSHLSLNHKASSCTRASNKIYDEIMRLLSKSYFKFTKMLKPKYFFLSPLFLVLSQSFFAQNASLPNHPVDPHLLHITWDTTTLRHIANGGYARMVELKNGKLITVYAASNGNTEIVISKDKGDHWSAPIIVAPKANGIRMDAPDILLLKDNSLMICYNPRPNRS